MRDEDGAVLRVADKEFPAQPAGDATTTPSGWWVNFGWGLGIDYGFTVVGSTGRTDTHWNCDTPKCQPSTHADKIELYGCTEHDGNASTPDQAGLIKMAWCVLNENLDLVKTSVSAESVAGAADGTTIANVIAGHVGVDQLTLSGIVTLVLAAFGALSVAAYMVLAQWVYSLASSNNVRVMCSDISFTTAFVIPGLRLIVVADSIVDQYAHHYSDSSSGSDPIKHQMCMVVDYAALLLHEVVHLAWLNILGHTILHLEGGLSTRVENRFRYYCLYRYCLLGWHCCDYTDYGTSTGGNYDQLVGDSDLSNIGKFAINTC